MRSGVGNKKKGRRPLIRGVAGIRLLCFLSRFSTSNTSSLLYWCCHLLTP